MENLGPYESYLAAPERCGLWTLKIELRGDAHERTLELLNLKDAGSWSYAFRLGRPERESFSPMIVPRLFAYLRATLTKDEREPRDGVEWRYFGRRAELEQRSRWYGRYRDLLDPPRNLSPSKKRSLKAARQVFLSSGLSDCQIDAAYENPTKLDIFSRGRHLYFQVAEARAQKLSLLTVYSPEKLSLDHVKGMFAALKVEAAFHLTKTFSPEETLLETYLRIAQLSEHAALLRQSYLIRSMQQALDEANAGRHVHAIRAIGIGTEELVVQIYETLLRDHAPAGPLGQLLQSLEARIAKLLGRDGRSTKPKDMGDVKRVIGELIDREKATTHPDQQRLAALVAVQKIVLPEIVRLATQLAQLEKRFPAEVHSRLFPKYVQRSLEDLVALRNRVSHRGDRGQALANVTHVDTATALRAFVSLARWWDWEQLQINFEGPIHAIVRDLLESTQKVDDEAAKRDSGDELPA